MVLAPDVAAGEGSGSPSDDRACGHCSRRISLVESVMRCRCGSVFCERHRAPESHDCPFDWRAMQKEKLARENPQVVKASSSITSAQQWCSQHEKFHPTRAAGERQSQRLHALCSLVFCAASARGLVLFLLRGQLLLLPQQIVLGYMIALVASRLLPRWLGLPELSCRYCLYSWEATVRPDWCIAAEWESLKEHLIFSITACKTNCLTAKLYSGPRTMSFILGTVGARLQELAGGAVCS